MLLFQPANTTFYTNHLTLATPHTAPP